MGRLAICITFVLALMASMAPARAQPTGDVKGSSDHALIPRYKGSEIRRHSVEAFDSYTLATGRIQKRDKAPVSEVAEKSLRLEGKVTNLIYRAPVDRSSLEVFRNYEEALKSAGFETLFTCSRSECGPGFNRAMNPDVHNSLLYDANQHYRAAKLARPQGDVYVALYVTTDEPSKRAYTKLTVIELKPMEQRMVVVRADEMEQAIARDGRIAIYGILFDFDKADIKPESKPQIDQLAELLKKNPKLEALIVGHTDGQGAFDYNLTLSQRRAQAIVTALVATGIAATRLTPAGAGMVAPVASNRTDAGRARNRRVEIVERVSSGR